MDNDRPVIVTDRGSNMISAFRNSNKIHCVNHLLHNIIEKAVLKVQELSDIVNKCSKLVKFFKKSGENSNLRVSLKSHCATRWNTIYYLLKSVADNWGGITNILAEKNEANRIDGLNIIEINSVLRMFAPFEEASKKLEGSKYPTIHLVIPSIYKLKKFCISDSKDNEITNKIKSILNELLSSTVLPNLTKYHKLALFLFPPTNKLLQFSSLEKIDIIKDCKEIMKIYLEEMDNEPVQKKQNLADNVFADFIQTQIEDDSTDKIDKEIQIYSNLNVDFKDDFNCIEWWNLQRSYFPLLFKTSCKVLSIPASSAASERAFSDARNLITEKRCLIATNSDNINKIMFLHSNIENIPEENIECNFGVL